MAARGLGGGAEGLSKLPKIKCPRGTESPEVSPRLQQRSPKTPRRRDGRLSAGAAFSLFFHSHSPISSPRAGLEGNGGRGCQASAAGDLFSSWFAASRGIAAKYTPQQITSALNSLVLSSSVNASSPRGSGSRTRASSGDGQVSSGARDARLESSESANEDLLLFFYQLDLNMRLQRALNQDQYEPAQQLREKITEVEREVARLRDSKLGGVCPKGDAQDKGITLLSLKAELSRAVEEEQYAVAAELQNKIARLEAEALAASAAALAAKNREYKLRLGQRVRHRLCGYTGLVAGMDPVCCETEEWREAAALEPQLLAQPFYQVLVDVKEGLGFPVAYVPESSLEVPEEPSKDRFDHPYVYLLFYGMDARGDFIPCQQLREKYNAPRHEVPEEEGEEGAQ